MSIFRVFPFAFLLLFGLALQPVFAQDINLQPKYGLLPKNSAQQAADAKFIADIDNQLQGDRKKGAEYIAGRGWQFLRQGKPEDAMRRFNQAWLLDHTNGNALWGMAVLQANSGKFDESLKLLAEAKDFIGDNIDFAVDHAKILGMASVEAKNEKLLQEALARFAHLHKKAPQHTLNLQNWAMTLYYVGNYARAWEIIKLAEATPRHADLDPEFLAHLQSKMPRP
ncbi:MAG: tetratricopeptide repeat protein [Zoogloeaceae bacterium]|nr:tetratricopeptide repeat protein [Zoogloeaceae bacterium]